MDWLQWAIPLTAFVVWLISNLVKSQEEQQRRPPVNRPRPLRDDMGEEEPRPRRTPAEIDKFLEEVRRRKQAKEQGRATPPPLPPVAAEEKPRSRQPTQRTSRPDPVRPARIDPVRAARPDVVRPSRPDVVRPPRPELVRHERGQLPEPVAIVAVEAIPTVESTLPSARPPTIFPHDTLAKRLPSDTARALHALLQNRSNLAAGILLMEVLGQPVCKRPGRGPHPVGV